MGEISPGGLLRGKYRVERVLGEGGMGVVVLATHLRLDQLVAIKMLRPEARENPAVVARFAREARAASRLRGEHSVRILDVDDSASGDPFLVMEYLEGEDLQRKVSEAAEPLPIDTVVGWVLQACEGLAEAHAAGIVHRDLKPANLFLTARPDQSPLIKLLDFGISKAEERSDEHEHAITKAETTIGSPSYMSPEQIKNAGAVDVRTDIWALGVVLYQLLGKALPFRATTSAALAARIAADPPRPLRDLRPDVPDELVALIERCLAKEREDRFADVAELARELSAFGPGGASGAARIARVIAAPRRSGERTGPASLRSEVVGPVTADLTATPAAGPERTASIAEAPRPLALEAALRTEDASSVSREKSVAEAPPQRGRARPAWLVPLAVGLGGVATFILLVRPPSPASPATPPSSKSRASLEEPARAPVASVPAQAVSAEAPAAQSSTVPHSSPALPGAATPFDGGRAVLRYPLSSPPLPGSTTAPAAPPSGTSPRNPMDLDFK